MNIVNSHMKIYNSEDFEGSPGYFAVQKGSHCGSKLAVGSDGLSNLQWNHETSYLLPTPDIVRNPRRCLVLMMILLSIGTLLRDSRLITAPYMCPRRQAA
jgi:hypothetical protein